MRGLMKMGIEMLGLGIGEGEGEGEGESGGSLEALRTALGSVLESEIVSSYTEDEWEEKPEEEEEKEDMVDVAEEIVDDLAQLDLISELSMSITGRDEDEDSQVTTKSIRTICSSRQSQQVAVEDIAGLNLGEAEGEEEPTVAIDAKSLDIRHKVVVMPHAPDMVCCASLKAWATWVKEVAENAKKWCMWIHQTIQEMRDMAAILRGEVFEEDGTVVTLKRETWNEFVSKLDKDVVRWRHYNEHVQDLTEQIIKHFHDKRVACCYLCEQENLNLSELGTEHLCEQLAEALDTTQYWRKWLHGMVTEAEMLTNLLDTQDTATIQEITSTSDLLAIAGATIMSHQMGGARSPVRARMAQGSVYSIEKISSSEWKKNKK